MHTRQYILYLLSMTKFTGTKVQNQPNKTAGKPPLYFLPPFLTNVSTFTHSLLMEAGGKVPSTALMT